MHRRSLTTSCNISHLENSSSAPVRSSAGVGRLRARLGIAALAAGLAILTPGAIAAAQPATPTPPGSVSASSVHPATSPDKAKPREPRRITPTERRAARTAIRQQVADRALKQAGKAYAAGAEGPHAFDCSGLTVFAWRGAGVELIHYSAGQYQEVNRIKPDDAVPGDLVFYLSRGARHVGVYIGDGKLVHASDYGVGVIVSSVRGTPWTNTHFTGFGRVPIPDDVVDDMVERRRQRA